MTYKVNEQNQVIYQKEYLNRLDFDECMLHNEWIVKQFEKLVDLF